MFNFDYSIVKLIEYPHINFIINEISYLQFLPPITCYTFSFELYSMYRFEKNGHLPKDE